MRALYSEKDLLSVNRKLNRRLVLLFAVTAVLLGVLIWAMIARIQWLAIVSACVAGCFAVFVADLFCMPLFRYRKLIRSALSGRKHTRALEFSRAEPDLSSVDGITCRGLIFLGDPDKHGTRDMLLYWDQEIPLPAFTPGEVYEVEYTGKNITGLSA